MVADGLRRIPQRVVGVDDDGAFAEIGFDVALKGVAGVDQQDGPAVGRPRRAQVVHVAGKQGKAADAVPRKDLPVQIARADDRQRHQRRLASDRVESCEMGGCNGKRHQRQHAHGDSTARLPVAHPLVRSS